VLVGSLQLRSLSDAGAELAEAVEADAGTNLQGIYADRAAKRTAKKAADEREKNHEKGGGH
jgi:hypothetical protein